MDRGTLYQLQALINRRNVVSYPSKSVAPCEEFFLLATEAHILAAAMHFFNMSSLDDTPSDISPLTTSQDKDSLQRYQVLMKELHILTAQFVNLQVTFVEDETTSKYKVDTIKEYAHEIMSLGLLLMEFNDAIREGDGSRIFRCWRFFLLIFKAADRKNYSIEAFNLLAQEKYLLSPRMAMQVKWSRTINVHGRPGKNIPGDLHMEHLNRECKQAISGLGANITDASIQRIGKCIGRLCSTLSQYDTVNSVKPESGHHTCHSTEIDLKKIVKQLQEASIFEYQPSRSHRAFPKLRSNMIKKVSREKLMKWMHLVNVDIGFSI